MEPLSGLDAAFLAGDVGNSRLHVAAVLVLDPPEGKRSLFSPSTRFAQIRRMVEQRIHLVPQLRQRAVRVPLGLSHPVWADDPEFDLDDHVRRAGLPAPGGPQELDDLVADVVSRPLDPDRPLWEMVVAEGLSGGRTAIVAKLHHAVVDGVSGASLLAAFLDMGPRGRPIPFPDSVWDPDPLPSSAALLRHAASSLAGQPSAVVGALQRGVDAFVDVAGHNRALTDGGDVPPPAPFSAPRTSLNGSLSPQRRYAAASLSLDDLKLVRRAARATVNDVLLCGVAGALRRLLTDRGERSDAPLVAFVPTSTRKRRALGRDGDLSLGNRLSGMLVSLATDVDDPLERLRVIARNTQVAKEQERLTGGRLLADAAQLASPALVSRAARWAKGINLSRRLRPLYNVTVSSVPGPSATLWCAGSRVSALLPVGPMIDGVGLNATAMTYQGAAHLGLLGCRRLVPEIPQLAEHLAASVDELVGEALDARPAAG